MKKDVEKFSEGFCLEEKDRATICAILNKLLASSYALYLKTQNYHWNVVGPDFYSYHLLFESQYQELATTIDEMAEHIRSLGFFPSASFTEFLNLSLIKDETKVLTAHSMIKQLLEDHNTLVCFLKENIALIEKFNDGAIADYLNKRLAVHEKTSWMLRSILT